MQKPPHDTSAYNPPAPECLGDWVTTDWYLVTFDEDGNLIDEEYLYSTSYCTDWGGGGGGGIPETCDNNCQEADQVLASITTEELFDLSFSEGIQSPPDANGITRKNKDPKWSFFKLNFIGAYYASYAANFNGILYKQANDLYWKWESLTYQNTTRTGLIPPCISLDMEVTCTTPLISTDKKNATVAAGGLHWDCEVTASCLGGYRLSTETGSNSLNQIFLAN